MSSAFDPAAGEPARPATPVYGKALVVVSVALSALFPLAFVVNDITLIPLTFSFTGMFPILAFVYTILDYVAVPVIVLALLVGYLAYGLARGGWRLWARAGLVLAWSSLAFLAVVLVLLEVVSALQQGPDQGTVVTVLETVVAFAGVPLVLLAWVVGTVVFIRRGMRRTRGAAV